MVSYRLFAVAGLVAGVYALPLNINLGAYSPALVVGDGEISFGGNQDVASLMNALEGAAVNAAAGQAAAPAVVAPVVAPVVGGATPLTGSVDTNLQEQAATISTLQGMGKEIAPREPEITEAPVAKRDLAGFDRALKYAEAALTKGPVVQLGTGEGGAGVGIIVDNRPAVAAGAGAVVEAPAAGARAKRDESGASQPRRRTKVTTMFVRRGVPAALQSSSKLAVREVQAITIPAAAAAMVKRQETSEDKRDTVDAINLTVDDPQGMTMTFVETSEEGDDE